MAASDGVAMTSVFPRQAGPGSAGWAARCRKAGVPEDCDEAKLAFAEHGAGPGGGTLILHGHWLALTGTDWHWLALAGTGWHWPPLLRDLHRRLAAIAATLCRNDRVAPGSS